EPVQALVFLAHDLRMVDADQNPGIRPDGTKTELKVRGSPAIRAIERSIDGGGVSHVRRIINAAIGDWSADCHFHAAERRQLPELPGGPHPEAARLLSSSSQLPKATLVASGEPGYTFWRHWATTRWKINLRFLILFAAAAIAGSPAGIAVTSAGTGGHIVMTASGPVRGDWEQGVQVFRGIPFAEPPVDALRFRPPVEHKAWRDVRPALDFAPACPQIVTMDVTENNNSVQSEDCL